MKALALILVLLSLAGCVTIPPQCPDCSSPPIYRP